MVKKKMMMMMVLIKLFNPYKGIPRWYSGKGSAYRCRRRRFNNWVKKIPWRRKWQPTPVFLLGKSCGQKSLAGYSPRGCKQSDTTEHTHTQSSQELYEIRTIIVPILQRRKLRLNVLPKATRIGQHRDSNPDSLS